MIIRVCDNCKDKPYTRNTQTKKCPRCGSSMYLESVDSEELIGKACLDDIVDNGNSREKEKKGVPEKKDADDIVSSRYSPEPMFKVEAPPYLRGAIKGIVTEYSCTQTENSGYKRNIIEKIAQYFLYGQSMEDVLHRFTLKITDEFGDSDCDVNVNIHGSIGYGAGITNNSTIMAEGKYANGVFWASQLYKVSSHNRSEIRIKKQATSLIVTMLIIAAVIGLIAALGRNSQNTNNAGVGALLFIAAAAIIALLISLRNSIVRRRNRRYQGGISRFFTNAILVAIVGILLVVFISSGAFTAMLTQAKSVLSALIAPVLTLAAIIYCLYRLIKG